jgi:hypothetical protein
LYCPTRHPCISLSHSHVSPSRAEQIVAAPGRLPRPRPRVRAPRHLLPGALRRRIVPTSWPTDAISSAYVSARHAHPRPWCLAPARRVGVAPVHPSSRTSHDDGARRAPASAAHVNTPDHGDSARKPCTRCASRNGHSACSVRSPPRRLGLGPGAPARAYVTAPGHRMWTPRRGRARDPMRAAHGQASHPGRSHPGRMRTHSACTPSAGAGQVGALHDRRYRSSLRGPSGVNRAY